MCEVRPFQRDAMDLGRKPEKWDMYLGMYHAMVWLLKVRRQSKYSRSWFNFSGRSNIILGFGREAISQTLDLRQLGRAGGNTQESLRDAALRDPAIWIHKNI